MDTCPKVLGADFELANSLHGSPRRPGGVEEAARLLLDEIPGFPLGSRLRGTFQERGRRFLAGSGGSAYIDADHLEINLPEHRDARDHPALMHAALRLAAEARRGAAGRLPEGEDLRVWASLTDGRESWGFHLSVLVARSLFDGLALRRPHLMGFLATHLATAPVFAGQGLVGAGNGRSSCDFQLSQRADWIEELAGEQTTCRRPLLNLRDEPHAGSGLARLHIISLDNVLSPVAQALRAGTTQLVLAMMEAGRADPALLVEDPVEAAWAVSRDLTLGRRLRMARPGQAWTAVEVQRALAEQAGGFVEEGLAEGQVPGAAEIVALWLSTLDLLEARDLAAAARRCDWAAKYLLCSRERGRRGLSWGSAELRVLDQLFADLDPEEGLFWRLAGEGLVEGMPAPARVERFLHEPPEDTRAWLRAQLLRRFGRHVGEMDWGWIRFRVREDRSWSREATLVLPDPAGCGREECSPLLEGADSLEELVAALGQDGQD